jgi:Tfp pilus assembly protein PilF
MIARVSLTGPRHSREWIAAAAILVTLAILPYLRTLGHDFVCYDDIFYVVENPHVRPGLTLSGIAWAFTTFSGGNWHPLTWVSHMLDTSVWGLKPAGHHFTNLILHAANTLLLFLVFGRMTGALWRSALVAALFAVHPLHVESVAWVAERKDVLSAFFGLLAIWAYSNYARDSSIKYYLLMLLLFGLGLMAKPMLVSLPCILLLLDIWPLRRWKLWRIDDQSTVTFESKVTAHVLLEKVPLLVLSAIFSIIAFASQNHVRAITGGELLPLSSRVGNAIVGYRLYLDKLFVPIKLAVFYPYPGYWRLTVVAVSAFLLLVITLVAVRYRRHYPWLLVGWLWFIVTLIPVIGLIQVGWQSIADRYTYIPSIGVFVMAAWSIPRSQKSLVQWAWIVAACTIITELALMARTQAGYWHDSRTLFTHAAQVTQGNYVAHQNLAFVMETEENDLDGALKLYREAAEETPKFARTTVHEVMANVLLRQGRIEEALTEARLAMELNPFSTIAANSMGLIMRAKGENAEAAKYFQLAVKLDPEYFEAQINYGMILVDLRRWDEAIAHLAPVARLFPQRYLARTYFARALAARGHFEQAIAQLKQVLELKPNHAIAEETLREIELEQKQQTGASPNQDSNRNRP